MSAMDLPRKVASIIETDSQAAGKLFDAARQISHGIPPLRADGLLENGIHLTSWPEMADRFAFNEHRQMLSHGMLHAAHDLRETRKVASVFGGGTFFTNKEIPRDFDITYEVPNQQSLFDVYNSHSLLRNRNLTQLAYGGDVLPNLKEYFQYNDRTGKTMGILKIDLNTLPPRPEPVSPAIRALRFENSWLFEFDPKLALAAERMRTMLGFTPKT